MKTIIFAIILSTMIPILSGCETLKGTAIGVTKDVENTGAAAYSAGKTVSAAFNSGDKNNSRGTVHKADDWIKQNIW